MTLLSSSYLINERARDNFYSWLCLAITDMFEGGKVKTLVKNITPYTTRMNEWVALEVDCLFFFCGCEVCGRSTGICNGDADAHNPNHQQA